MTFSEVPFTDLLLKIVDNRGRTCPVSPDGMPLIATNCIVNDRLYPSYDATRRVSQETYSTWFRGHPLPGDLIFVCKGSPGRVCMAPDPVDFCIAQDMVAIRADPGRVYPRFLFAVLRSPLVQARIGNMHVGSLIPHFKKGDFHKLQIPVPDRTTQTLIGDIYFELSAKIESNRQTSQTLERVARSIFRAWFVDFEPVKAKASGAHSFLGMPQEIFDALPIRLVESELGLVPEGWGVKPLDEAMEVNPPRRLTKGIPAPYLDMGQMPTDGHAPTSWVEREAGSGARFMNGDTLVARITPCLENGKTAFVDFLNEGQVAWGSTEYIVLRPKPPIPNLYAYLLARTPEFRAFAIQQMTGSSGRQRVPFSTMSKFNVAFGPLAVMKAFGEAVEPLFSRSSASVRESRSLVALRDYLLPKLLSGEIRVRET